MKTIGLLGGMSWESTLSYYKLLNEEIRKTMGGLHSAQVILYSVDFAPIEELQREGKWEEAGSILALNAKSLELAGADFILICTNTMHKVIDIIQKDVHIPIIHIAKATSKFMLEEKIKKSILLGTRFTMKENFFKDEIIKCGIEVIIPTETQIAQIDNIIFNELVLGEIKPQSKRVYLDIIKTLCAEHQNIDSVILGCTEIGLLINQNDTNLKIFDTTVLHVKEALNLALQK